MLVHSLATAHSTQSPPALQIFFAGSVQSAPLMHATQKPRFVLQVGVEPLQSESALQLVMH